MKLKNVILSLTCVLLILSLAISARGGTITVPTDNATLQEAINAANPGDVIVVLGTGTPYAENLLVNKTVTLIGQDTGSGLPVIDGGGGKAINITSESVHISYFVIENASSGINASTNSNIIEHNRIDSGNGSGIYIKEASSNRINDNIITSEEVGIFLDNYAMHDAKHQLQNNTIVSNHKSIILYDSYNNTISNNTLTSGADTAIMVFNADGNKLLNNLVLDSAYGIYLNGAFGGATVSRNTIQNSSYSGMYINNSYNVVVSDNLIADSGDKGIYLTRSSYIEIYQNTFSGNLYGIDIVGTGGSGNVIYLNDFANTQNAYTTYSLFQRWNTSNVEYSFNGSFHTGYLGNYWNNYAGSDGDFDGIGDTAQSIPVTAQDPHPLMESAKNYTLVPLEANLIVKKDATPDPASVGDPVTWTINVTNTGPFTAVNTRVTDEIAGLVNGTILSTDPVPASVTAENFTWNFPALDVGETMTITLVVNFSTAGQKLNRVTGTSDIPDPDPGDNLCDDTISINKRPPAPTPTPTPTPRREGGGGQSFLAFSGQGSPPTSNEAKVLMETRISAADERGRLILPKDVTASDADGKRIREIAISPIASNKTPEESSGIFRFSGYAYECTPSGAIFDPSIIITFTLTEDAWNSLSGGEFVIRWWDEDADEWVSLPTKTDPETLTVSAEVHHFTIFALFVKAGIEPVSSSSETGAVAVTPAPEPAVLEETREIPRTTPAKETPLLFAPVLALGMLPVLLRRKR